VRVDLCVLGGAFCAGSGRPFSPDADPETAAGEEEADKLTQEGIGEVELVTRLQKFYGGAPEAWFHAPAWLLKVYAEMLPRLDAEHQLQAIEAAAVPHMKPESSKWIFRRLHSLLGRKEKPIRPKSPDDLAAFGIRTTFVTKEQWESGEVPADVSE
jgi:hypothetical protein